MVVRAGFLKNFSFFSRSCQSVKLLLDVEHCQGCVCRTKSPSADQLCCLNELNSAKI